MFVCNVSECTVQELIRLHFLEQKNLNVQKIKTLTVLNQAKSFFRLETVN